MSVKVADQHEQVLGAFRRVERIEEIAARVPDAEAGGLHVVVDEMLDEMPPVRVAVAAELLELTKPTVTKWCERGVLRSVAGAKVRSLDPHRLHEVLHIVRELRAAADKPGNLIDEVWHRLQDRALLESDEVRRGLAAWKAGNLQEA